MNVLALNPISFRLEEGGKTLYLCFLSDHSFRLSENEGLDSVAIDALPSYEGKVAYANEGEEHLFRFGEYALRLSPGFGLRVSKQEQAYLDLSLHSSTQGEEGDVLLSLEGHRACLRGDCRGGFRILNDRPVYGLGEKTGPLDKRGYDYINWNTDDPSAHVDTFKSLYQSIPFFILHGLMGDVGVFLDNTYKTYFDFNKREEGVVNVQYEDGLLDLYFFFGTMKEVVSSFSGITGRGPLPPYWSLGAQQCRWSYPSAHEIEAVIQGYRRVDIPLSTVYLDIDYMQSYKDFTVDPYKFPDVSAWLHGLLNQGIRVVPIIDAGVKAEEGYFLYDEGMYNGYFSTQYGSVYHNEVWPGDSVFPAFKDERVQSWWASHIKEFLGLGFSGIWNDMNEPASFKGPLPMDVDMGNGHLHREVHNVYGHLMAKAGAKGFELANKRLFQLTRAGYAGIARYSASWAGDNQSIYDHIRLSLPQLMNMSLSGQSYVGVDIGGFGGDATPELLVRWAVAALFNPLYRNHSALGTASQEPYLLKGKYLEAYREAVLTRYELLPTLYDLLHLAETKGEAVLRPLVYNYPLDESTWNENTEVMLGDALLLSPALFPGQEMRSVYFPEDCLDFFSGETFSKGHHLVDCRIGKIPLFLVKSKIAILAAKGNKQALIGDTLRILCGDDNASTFHYVDEGDGLDYCDGIYNEYHVEVVEGKPRIIMLHQGMEHPYQTVVIQRPGQGEETYSFESIIVKP